MASNASFRAGGIHWAATLDAGGFTKGATAVKAEASRLQRELAVINKQFATSPVERRFQAAQAKLRELGRQSELDRFQKQTADNIRQGLFDLAKYEASSTAIVAANKKSAVSFQSLRASVNGVFGKGGGLDMLGKLAKGGGAILGINLVADAIGNLAKEATKLTVAMNGSNFTKGQVFEGVITGGLQAIPVLRNINDAGTAIFDWVDALRHGKPFAALADDARVFEQRVQNIRDEMEQLNRQLRDAGKPPSEATKIEDRYRDSMKAMQRRRGDALSGDLDPDRRAQLERAFDAEARLIAQLRDKQLAALNLKKQGNAWANALGRGFGSVGGNLEDTANSFLGDAYGIKLAVASWWDDVTKAGDERIKAATERWKDRFTTWNNTVKHWLENLERQRDKFNENLEQNSAISDMAQSAFALLRSGASNPQFAGADFRGSQGAISAINQNQFKSDVKLTNELLQKLIEWARRQFDEQKTIADAYDTAARQPVVL